MGIERFTHGRSRLAVRSCLLGTLILATVGVASGTLAASAGTLRSSALVAGGTTSLIIPGITGSGTPKGPGYINVLSWSWGVHNIGSQGSSSGAGRESSSPSVSEIVVTKALDKSSPLLWKNCVSGTHFKTVTLYMDPAPSSAGAPAGDGMTVTMSNARISHISISSGGDRPTESVSFTFAKIKVDYTPQDGATVHFSWDVKSNKSA
jgi:type VI secretion system secreted protein Hcp